MTRKKIMKRRHKVPRNPLIYTYEKVGHVGRS